jgi:endonuclease YncB( thermonuclease family)
MLNIKNFLKSFFSPLVAIALVFTLAACTSDKKEEEPSTELNTSYTDALELTTSYEGKTFLADRIGEVTLFSCVDGDTAVFRTNGQNIRVRFLGIDTPESTGKLDPWGKAASAYVCDRLENATTIVLEGEGDIIDTTGTRYLAWIWVDGRLLNLEILEQAYSTGKGLDGFKYANIFYDADLKTQRTGRRVWGESDPDFDYSGTVRHVTIEEIRENLDDYRGLTVIMGGLVTRRLGNSAYIEYDGYGIYVYNAYNPITSKLEPGNFIRIQASIGEFNGSNQLTGVHAGRNINVESENNDIEATVVTIPDIGIRYEGALIELQNVTISNIGGKAANNSYSITVRDESNNTIIVRVDGNTFPYFEPNTYSVGQKINVTAPINYFNDTFQLMLTNAEDISVIE